MGMSTGGGKPGSVQSDINVTPLIDVLLVLLIIFLVIMPVMMKMETLQVPRKIDEQREISTTPNLTITVHKDLTITYNDGDKDASMPAIGANAGESNADLAVTLRPKLEAMHTDNDKVVFVDFEPEVPWSAVVETMDTVRVIAADVNHDEIKVALKIKEDQPK